MKAEGGGALGPETVTGEEEPRARDLAAASPLGFEVTTTHGSRRVRGACTPGAEAT